MCAQGRSEGHLDADFRRRIDAARAGSVEALGELLAQCRAYLLLVANRELPSGLHAKGGASDLVQETCLCAQRDFARFRGNTEAELLAWLRRILEHQLANFVRRYRTGMRQTSREVQLEGDDSSGRLPLDAPDEGQSPSDIAIRQEQLQAIEQALARLPEHYRQAIVSVNREHRSFAELGQLLGRSAAAARRLWSRAIERLEQELDRPHESSR